MKKRIAIVITKLELGGAQQIALFLAENLDRKKFEVFLIAGTGGYLDKKVSKKIKLNLWEDLTAPISPIKDIKTLFKMKQFFIDNKIDIVHTHSSKAGILGRLAAKLAGVKKIIHTVHGFSFHEYQNPFIHAMYVLLEKMAAPWTNTLVAVGKNVQEYGLKKGIGKKSQYKIIRAGIDIGLFRKNKAGHKNKVFTVGMLGNLKAQKNPMAFVEIAKKTLALDTHLQFVFAGDGPMRKQVKEKLKAYNIETKVNLIGWTDKPDKFLQSLDLFLLTSLWEGLPCTIAQAIAAGKPCVVSNIAGNKELILDKKTGLTYPCFDYRTAAEDIIFLKNNKKTAAKYTKAAYEMIEKDFDLKNMLKQYLKIYNSI
ncbi:MAG: glycosyltransferase family 4 protein [bacterium]